MIRSQVSINARECAALAAIIGEFGLELGCELFVFGLFAVAANIFGVTAMFFTVSGVSGVVAILLADVGVPGELRCFVGFAKRPSQRRTCSAVTSS